MPVRRRAAQRHHIAPSRRGPPLEDDRPAIHRVVRQAALARAREGRGEGHRRSRQHGRIVDAERDLGRHVEAGAVERRVARDVIGLLERGDVAPAVDVRVVARLRLRARVGLDDRVLVVAVVGVVLVMVEDEHVAELIEGDVLGVVAAIRRAAQLAPSERAPLEPEAVGAEPHPEPVRRVAPEAGKPVGPARDVDAVVDDVARAGVVVERRRLRLAARVRVVPGGMDRALHVERRGARGRPAVLEDLVLGVQATAEDRVRVVGERLDRPEPRGPRAPRRSRAGASSHRLRGVDRGRCPGREDPGRPPVEPRRRGPAAPRPRGARRRHAPPIRLATGDRPSPSSIAVSRAGLRVERRQPALRRLEHDPVAGHRRRAGLAHRTVTSRPGRAADDRAREPAAWLVRDDRPVARHADHRSRRPDRRRLPGHRVHHPRPAARLAAGGHGQPPVGRPPQLRVERRAVAGVRRQPRHEAPGSPPVERHAPHAEVRPGSRGPRGARPRPPRPASRARPARPRPPPRRTLRSRARRRPATGATARRHRHRRARGRPTARSRTTPAAGRSSARRHRAARRPAAGP